MTLPKKIAWLIFFLLLCLEALVTYLVGNGQEGNSLWRPIVTALGFKVVFLIIPLVFIFFYFLVKLAGWLVERLDKLPHGEEIILTALVITYATYDLYLILVPRSFGYLGTKSHYALIPLLIIPGLIYGLWLEHLKARGKLKKLTEKKGN